MNKIINKMEKAINFICALLVAFLTIVVSTEVISRYFFCFPIAITTELTNITFPWITALAAIVITIHEENISLMFVKEKFSPRMKYYVEILINLLSITFCGIMVKSSIELSLQLRTQTMALLGFSKIILYGSFAIGFIMMTIVLIYQLILKLRGKDNMVM
ncbi:TRAP-type C4-dicarboxylate transport system, small permease component [Anaerovirgula multivorans]|uniref:TRAP-type C4-dicarboxylate transport system, small permease component n=1 Tax=Anaerovirgula multivorans TaxID=312168 RepID=A0A239IBP3_9FIRM|nr:TRAP transporter small permease [Anaerovirgula multivorans]SNS90977.1 TRAP-type C4-dicarboxylate transport system, small permease component [Anaerovirgula multivorans]